MAEKKITLKELAIKVNGMTEKINEIISCLNDNNLSCKMAVNYIDEDGGGDMEDSEDEYVDEEVGDVEEEDLEN